VVEDILVPALLIADVRPPVRESSPGEGIIAATRMTLALSHSRHYV
jgi:hypothetical protein